LQIRYQGMSKIFDKLWRYIVRYRRFVKTVYSFNFTKCFFAFFIKIVDSRSVKFALKYRKRHPTVLNSRFYSKHEYSENKRPKGPEVAHLRNIFTQNYKTYDYMYNSC